nr:hypothetical protein [Bacteroidota bacterium]
MYGITEAEDGGFVISGNYSSNMDDAYLAKLYPNCQNNLVYDIDGYDGIPNSWNLIDASTLPNPLTGAHNIRGVIAVGPGLNFTIGNAASTSLKFADSRQTGIPTYIVVLPGGQLNIEGTQTTLDVEQGCNDYTMWDGIEVWGQPTLSNSFANQGVCYIKDGATIKNARMAAMACSGLRDGLLRLNPNFINGGGYIRASNAKFENWRRSIHYGPYYASSAFNFIADCDFETNAPMRDKYYQNFVDPYFRPVGNNAFVTDYRSNGLLVTRNNFKVFYNFDEDIRGTAVGSYDARINIDNNVIWRLTTGIETVNGSAVLTPVTATDNTITAQYGFTGLSGAFHSIKNNQFNVPTGGLGFTTPYGIAMISSPAFTIEGNTFDGASKSENFGVIVHNSNQMGGVVGKTNTFNNINVATQTEYNNDFLQISCNTYNDNTFDWAISPEFPSLGTLATQGTGCDPVNKIRAGNTFNVNTNGAFSHIFTPGVQFKYYANGTPGETVPTLISPILANGNFEDVENCFNGPDAVSCTKPNPCPTLPCDDLKMAYQKENNAQLKKQFFNEWISINSLNDSINNDSILVDFISKSNDENKDVLLLKHFFDKQQFSFASTYLANIKGKPQHVSEFNIYTYLLSKVVNGQLKLNKKDKQELKSYSEQSGAGAYVAQAYLKNIFNVNSKFTPELIGNKTPRLAVNNNSIRENTIKLFPQPASETVVVHCITNDIGSGFLTINEITGKHIETIALSNINAEIILQVADLFSGVYVLQLHNVSGETLGYHKLVIAK